ncbi:uracil-DNA glycosylase [Knoellia locipacati]|uniref:uracil-DNA glycosylase n=1 Tax=Knoellia locipacati TaxID=882824 RepID=UPI00384E33AC
MGTNWDTLLAEESAKSYWTDLQRFVADERARGDVYPPEDEVFAALNATPYEEVKVVILGQDPYPGSHEANGLAFSVQNGIGVPASLRNIFTELESDLGIDRPNHGSLTHWANEGVLLLNTVLTVRADQRDSHRGAGWETFTDEVLRKVSARDEPVVFMLWGNPARSKRNLIASHHLVIESSHPSDLSAGRTSQPFYGSRPFSTANDFLKVTGREIDWRIPD